MPVVIPISGFGFSRNAGDDYVGDLVKCPRQRREEPSPAQCGCGWGCSPWRTRFERPLSSATAAEARHPLTRLVSLRETLLTCEAAPAPLVHRGPPTHHRPVEVSGMPGFLTGREQYSPTFLAISFMTLP
jgi:hypothetical protein